MSEKKDNLNLLGRRIRFFRKREGFSQMKLEVDSGLSNGVISRIENGEINPTKETVLKIAEILELNIKEVDYLIGVTAKPASQKEIESAMNEANEAMNVTGKFAYLLDDRWRFTMFSDISKSLTNMNTADEAKIIGMTTAESLVDRSTPAFKWIFGDSRKEILRLYLPQYYSEMSYMADDEHYLRTVAKIKDDPIAKEIWQNLENGKSRKYTKQEDLYLIFNSPDGPFKLFYYTHPLTINNRFLVVEFYTEWEIEKFF